MIGPLLVVAAHLLDAWTFQLFVTGNHWMAGEANPAVHLIVGTTGTVGLAVLKLGGGMAAGGFVLWLRRRADSWRRVPPDLPLVLAAGLGIVGAASNLLAA